MESSSVHAFRALKIKKMQIIEKGWKHATNLSAEEKTKKKSTWF